MSLNIKQALWLAVVVGAVAAAADAPLSPEQAIDRRSIGEVALSPDGGTVAFTVTEPPKGTGRQRNIWAADVSTGRVRQLTFSPKNDYSPRWSPDGRSIAFLSDRAREAAQLYVLPLAGGEAEAITERKDPISAFRWSPDGRRIALLMPEPKPDVQEKREKEKDDGRVAEKSERLPRVWMLDVASKRLTQTTRENWRIRQIEWMPDGSRLLAAATPKPASNRWDEHLASVDLQTGAFTDIAVPRGPVGAFAVSPDGASIVYAGARVDGPEPHDLWLQPIAGGAATNLTARGLDRPIRPLRWIAPDQILALVDRGFATAIVNVTPSARVSVVDGTRGRRHERRRGGKRHHCVRRRDHDESARALGESAGIGRPRGVDGEQQVEQCAGDAAGARHVQEQ